MLVRFHLTESLEESPPSFDSLLEESKDISSKKSNAYREVMARLKQSLVEPKEDLKKRYSILQNSYGRSLQQAVRSKSSSRIKTIVLHAFQSAYRLGYLSSSTSGEFHWVGTEKEFLQRAVNTEVQFAWKFGRVYDYLSPAQVANRVRMYKQTLDSMFLAGWLSNFPSDTKVWWVLNAKESCSDCIKLAAGSPYTLGDKNPLPTTPRSGYSKCLSNCRCTLRLIFPGSPDDSKTEHPLLNQSSILTKSKSKAAQELNSLYSRMNALRQRITIEGRAEVRKALMAERRDLNDRAIEIAEKSKIQFTPRYSSKDIEDAVKGYRSPVSPRSIQAGDKLALVQNVYSFPVEVKRVVSSGLKLSSVYGDLDLPKSRYSEVLLFSNENS